MRSYKEERHAVKRTSQRVISTLMVTIERRVEPRIKAGSQKRDPKEVA